MKARLALWLRVSFVALLGALALGVHCPTPQPRPSTDPDGSARWAYAIAQPTITAFAADVELRQVLGATVMVDGRLFANTGTWSFVAYSPSLGQTIQVTVSYDGTTSTSQRAVTPPGPGVVRPLPSGWVDSTTAFQATAGHRDPSASSATLVVLNVTSFPQAPGEAVWGINFNAGSNQLVRWDGTYIGPQ
jgi:hypothetical protein